MASAISFVRAGRPPTANKRLRGSRRRAGQELPELYRAAGGSAAEGHLYGIVYYFVRGYRPTNDADADNVSKRVWDALEGVAYQDDEVVRLRIAGVIETGGGPGNDSPRLEQIDLSDLSPDVARALLDLVGRQEAHILYVELGPLNGSMFLFNLAPDRQQQL
jgi:hypothetical protein